MKVGYLEDEHKLVLVSAHPPQKSFKNNPTLPPPPETGFGLPQKQVTKVACEREKDITIFGLNILFVYMKSHLSTEIVSKIIDFLITGKHIFLQQKDISTPIHIG